MVHFNDYTFDGETAFVVCKNKIVLVDFEDIPKISDRRWFVLKNGYVQSGDKKYLHRIIANCPDGFVVDHINHNRLDNRKSNLRVCSYSVNNINAQRTAEGREFGIRKNKRGYFLVEIGRRYIGCSKNFELAVEMRDEALKGSMQERYNEYLK